MIAPDHIKQYLDTVNVFSKHTRGGGLTPRYVKLLNMCEEAGYDLMAACGGDIDLKSMKLVILHDLSPPRCICGKITSHNFNAEGNLYARRCCTRCRSNDPLYTNKISKVKTALYDDPEWKAKTEAKKVDTTIKNHGVAYPMQKLEIFEKQQSACFDKDENGHHGFEPYVWAALKPFIHDLENGTEFMKREGLSIQWHNDQGLKRRSYPDFFSKSLNTFFEVKSTYTYEIGMYKVAKCAERVGEMGFGYIVVIYEASRKHATVEIFNRPNINT